MTRALLLATLLLAGAAHAQKAPPPIGAAPVTGAEAQRLFGAACMATLPRFAGAEAVLAAEGMAPNPETGTFYHPSLNLSVQVDDVCSMVFVSEEPAGQLGLLLAMGAAGAAGGEASVGVDPATGSAQAPGPGGSFLYFEPIPSPDGQAYYRVVLEPGR